MTQLLLKIIVSVVIGGLVYAVCFLVGPLLSTAGIPIISTVGAWLVQFAALFALAAAILYFAFGRVPASWSV